MAWIAIWIPLMAVGVAVATVPLVFATHHQYKYGHHGSYPDRPTAQGTASDLNCRPDRVSSLHSPRRGSSTPPQLRPRHRRSHRLAHRCVEVGGSGAAVRREGCHPAALLPRVSHL